MLILYHVHFFLTDYDPSISIIAGLEDDEEEKVGNKLQKSDTERPVRTLRSGKAKLTNEILVDPLPDVKRTRTPRGKDKDKSADIEAPGQLNLFKFSLSEGTINFLLCTFKKDLFNYSPF